MTKKAYKKAILIDADVYHFHDPEFLIWAYKLSKKGKKVIYDVHEDVPIQIKSKYWIPGIIRKPLSILIRAIEKWTSKRFSGIITSTDFIAERFKNYNQNVASIKNYPIHQSFGSSSSTDLNQLCYIGLIDANRGVREVIQAIEGTEFTLNLAGSISPSTFEQELKSLPGWQNVNYLGLLDKDKIPELLNSCSIGIVTLMPIENYKDSLPIKMFEYMAAGLAVLSSNFPFWEQILTESQAGISCNPLDIQSIRKALRTLKEDEKETQNMGIKGKAYIHEKANWKIEAKKLLLFYAKLINGYS